MFAPPPSTGAPSVQQVVVERAPRDAPELGLVAGALVVTFRLDRPAASVAAGLDALATVHGLGQRVRARRAPFSTDDGNCLEARPSGVLRSWHRGRRVTVDVRTGDGADASVRSAVRVKVVPLNLGDTEQSYATTRLGCFSIVE